MITKVINVNLHQPIYERLTAKQGDIASRYLLFHLLDGDKPFDLTNRTVRVYAIKPDKTEIFNDLTINDASKGYCTLELTSQCLASAGVVKMELYISESDKVLTSIPFELEVIACINTANSVNSTNEFSALEVALSSLQDYDNLRREISGARNGYRTVGKRLNDFDSQLDTKANEVDLLVERKRIDSFVSLPEGTTQGDGELIDGRIGANAEEYDSIGNNIRSIGSALHYVKPKNLANQEGRLINTGFFHDGTLDTSSEGYTVLDYIEVEEGQHIYSSRNGALLCADSLVTYNSNKEIVAWNQFFMDMIIPSGVSYVRVMLSESNLDGYQIELNGITAYEPYHKPYYAKCAKESDVELLKNNMGGKNIIVVRQDGNGDYTTLNEALNSIKDNSSTNQYLILLHEGVYNVCSHFTSNQINNAQYTDTGFVGLEIKTGVYIEGVGIKEKIIIHGEIPTSYSQNKREQISTLNLKGKCGLKNLTVTSKYIRYAVHDDFSHNENVEHDIENCDFINLIGSDGVEFSSGAYGLGTKSGTIVKFNKCFIKPGMVYHTNTSFTKPSVVDMKDCYVDGEITLWDFNTTGLDCYLYLYNTRYNNIRHAYNGTEKRQYIKIKGIGNSKSPIICDSSVTYKTAETIEIKNNSSFTIPIGKAVKRTGMKTIEPMYSTDDPKLFYGIAIQTIESGKSGLIQTKGYINSNFVGLTLNVGDKIGVVNGALSIVTENEIGKVEFAYDDIKLIKLH